MGYSIEKFVCSGWSFNPALQSEYWEKCVEISCEQLAIQKATDLSKQNTGRYRVRDLFHSKVVFNISRSN